VCVWSGRPAAQTTIMFLGVSLDESTRQADKRLQEYLYAESGVAFSPSELEYEGLISSLIAPRAQDGPFVARVTPYAYVVAELLGARVEPIATYVSASTDSTTYRSYFVVNRRAFERQPDLTDLVRFLRDQKRRARFVYQSPFSTSSFFVPSLYFRAHQIFNMPESAPPLTAIRADRIADASTSQLVDLVASGEADIAAVWDGVKARVEKDPAISGKVFFVGLPTVIPNDLLVCASSLDAVRRDKLEKAIASMKPDAIGLGDFRTWQPIREATDARLALGELRQAARSGTDMIPMQIELAEGASIPPARASALLDAARQAVHLSETEFTLYDADFHAHFDFRWRLEPVHDGAVVLHSSIAGADIPEQTFQLSFRDSEDLTSRLVSIIHSRLHRIRYIWPFSIGGPSIIRDIAFELPVGAPVSVQHVTWIDPERDKFTEGKYFRSSIRSISPYRYQLPVEDFPGAAALLDPLSNEAYRVILQRAATRPWVFQALTMALVACFVLAGAASGITLARQIKRRPVSSGSGPK